MTSPAESKLSVEIDLLQGMTSSFHQITHLFDKVADTLQAKTQPAKNALTTTDQIFDPVTTATSNLLKTITETTQQTRQAAGQIQSKTSEVMQTAIASSINDWLQAHPTAWQLIQVLTWAIEHPIISVIVLLLLIAVAWSLIKAINRLFELLGLSLLQAPFKLVQFFIKKSTQVSGKFNGLAIKPMAATQNLEIPNIQNKQQRLIEIFNRLKVIQNEQDDLLQEAALILTSDKTDIVS